MEHELPIVDNHAHLVIYEPDGYPNKIIHSIADNKVGFFILKTALKTVIPWSNKDRLDKLVNFIESNKDKDWKDKFNNWRKEGQWSGRTQLNVLTVNMAHMGCGIPKKTFGEACEELERLRQDYPENINPYFHYDCRSGNAYTLFNHYVVEGYWGGMKSYSSMGTFPYDQRYWQAYSDLQEANKPIIAHCTYSNPIHFLGPEKELKILLGDKYDPKASRKENCDKFTNPLNWIPVLEAFPKLRICLAHFGGQEQWREWYENPDNLNNLVNIILEMMRKYPNLWVDISFTLNDKKLWPVFYKLFNYDEYKFIRDRILFGTDWDMTKSEVNLKQWSDEFRQYIGETTFDEIARVAPYKFKHG